MNPFSILDLSHKVFTVSELNNNTKLLLEQTIPLLWVKGEISNLKCYPSGHWYFSLKDSGAQVRCVIFSHKNRYIDWVPRDGMQVEVCALVTLYESRGDFQLNVETMRQAGLGKLFEAFEQLKSKLEKAGLFNPSKKKPLPAFPEQIGIITSPDTAALRDVLSTLQRRMPSLPIIIYPTLVQGKTAAGSIARAIETANQRAECDVLILCRGGGGIEDLWAFNEEVVARAIAAGTIPIISGIGHETDFTIADFVADARAPTPTGAAELVSKDKKELQHRLFTLFQHMHHHQLHRIEQTMQRTDSLSHRLIHPGERIQNQLSQLHGWQDRLIKTWSHQNERRIWQLTDLNQRAVSASPNLSQLTRQHDELTMRFRQVFSRYLDALTITLQHRRTQFAHLNPQSVLERGYSITYSAQGTVIRDSKQIHASDKIQVKFAHGLCEADVTQTRDS